MKARLVLAVGAWNVHSEGVLAERQGFEPWDPSRSHPLSRRAHSTALAPLHGVSRERYYNSHPNLSRFEPHHGRVVEMADT